jgi:hypothetical protein
MRVADQLAPRADGASAFSQLLAEHSGANNCASDAWRHMRDRRLIDTALCMWCSRAKHATVEAELAIWNARPYSTPVVITSSTCSSMQG